MAINENRLGFIDIELMKFPMLDVNKKIIFSEVFVLSRIIKINQLENSHHSPIFLFLHHLPVFHHLPFATLLILYVIARKVTRLNRIIMERLESKLGTSSIVMNLWRQRLLLQQYLKRCLPSITKQLRLLLRHYFLIYPSAPESKLGKDHFCSEGDVTEYQGKIDKESAEVINSKIYCKESVDSDGNDAESIKREPNNFTELWKRLKKDD